MRGQFVAFHRLVVCVVVAGGLMTVAGGRPLLAADDAAWPPVMKGVANGRATVATPQLLDIPASVAKAVADGKAVEFDVAKQPPTVHWAFHDKLGSGAATRRLWSSWGDIALARDGRVYCAIGDHGDDRGGDARCFLYMWDPTTKTLRQIVDMNVVVPPRAGVPAWSKVHAKIDEGPDGKIYFSCTLNDGNRAGSDTYAFDDKLPGGQIYCYDPKSDSTTTFTSLPSRRCTATSRYDAARHIWWCNLESGDGNALWGYDLAAKKVVFQGKDGSVGFNRAFGLLRDGSLLYNGEKTLALLDAKTHAIRTFQSTLPPVPVKPVPVKAPKKPKGAAAKEAPATPPTPPAPTFTPGAMRAVSEETKDGWVYGVTYSTNLLFKFSPKSDSLKMLGPTWLEGEYTTVCELSPDERFLYYLPGAHGRAWNYGTPVVQYNVATGKRKVLAFLAAASETGCEFVPGGTYGMKVSADGSRLFVNFNGHPADAVRPEKMKPIGFGLTAFAEIEIPASER